MKKILHVLNWFGDRGSEKTVLNAARSLTDYKHMFMGKVVLSEEAMNDFLSVGTCVMEEKDPHPGSFNYPSLTNEFVREHAIDLVIIYLPGDNLPPHPGTHPRLPLRLPGSGRQEDPVRPRYPRPLLRGIRLRSGGLAQVYGKALDPGGGLPLRRALWGLSAQRERFRVHQALSGGIQGEELVVDKVG